MAILTVDKLTKCYGDIAAVDNISFEVNKGELLGFLGVNGAGKSTTIIIFLQKKKLVNVWAPPIYPISWKHDIIISARCRDRRKKGAA